MDDTCSFCVEQFEHAELVWRRACRHMCHNQCWEHCQRAAAANGTLSQNHVCPNCRGVATLIASWRYVDERRVTQTIDREEIPNLIGMFAEQCDIKSPEVACHKIQEYLEGESCNGEPKMWRPRPSSQEDHRVCHFQTRLADGRQALIVDAGSVGNLCGDAWAREVAK